MLRRSVLLFVIAFISLSLAIGTALAVAPGKTIEYKGGTLGKVILDGKTHADKGLKCNDCHPKIFAMKGPGKEGSVKMTMKDMNEGKFCGTCHNGTKAFSTKEAPHCAKCHKKQ